MKKLLSREVADGRRGVAPVARIPRRKRGGRVTPVTVGRESTGVATTFFSRSNHADDKIGVLFRKLDQRDSNAAFGDILRSSKKNNKTHGLTGALVVNDQWFLQVLEGERRSVWRTFERIRDDERHSDLVVAELVDVEAQIFGNSWMGLAVGGEKTEAVFSRFARDGRFDPRRMKADEMLSMMVALAGLGLSRELATTQEA